MSYRSIIAGFSGGSATSGTVELACSLAKRLGAHLEGFHVTTDVSQLLLGVGDTLAMPNMGPFMERFEQDAKAVATKTQDLFNAALQRQQIATGAASGKGASATWRQEAGNASALLAQRARFFDLVVLGRSDRVNEHPHTDAIERVLIDSGRPVMLAPATALAAVGENIALGWNGSAQAVRAMAAALPLLTTARTVSVIAIGDGKQSSADAAVAYLGQHGITAKAVLRPLVKGNHAGADLLSAAHDQQANLLVMGGYGHTPWREYVFGGATHDIVETSRLPLFLVH